MASNGNNPTFSFGAPSANTAGSIPAVNPFAGSAIFGGKLANDNKTENAKPISNPFSGFSATPSVGSTSTTSASAPSLFSNLGASAAVSPQAGGSSFFGGKATSTTPTQGIFGGIKSDTPSFNFGSKAPNATGQASESTTGASAAHETTAPTSKPLAKTSNFFSGAAAATGGGGSSSGGLGSATQSPTPTGSSTPTTMKPSFSFLTSTTPAGPPPGDDKNSKPITSGSFDFGGAGGLFGAQNTAPSSTSDKPATTQSSKLFESSTPVASSGGGFFGDFGKPAESRPAASSVTPASGSGLFGTTGSAIVPSSGMFGGFGKVEEDEAPKSSAAGLSATGTGSLSSFGRIGQAEAPATALKPTGGLFGGLPAALATSASGASASATTGVSTAAPKVSLFGGLTSNAPASAPTAPANKPAFTFPSLGDARSSAKASTAATATTSTGPASGLFAALGSGASKNVAPTTSGLFGTLDSSSTDSSTTVQASAAPTKSGLFGHIGSSFTSSSTGTPATAAPAGGLFGALGKAPIASASAAPAASTKPATGLFASLGASVAASSPATATTSSAMPSTSTTTASAPNLTNAGLNTAAAASATTSTKPLNTPPQSRLKNKSMEDIINGWAADLLQYQKQFQSQAEKVATWDRLLAENGEKIQKLFTSTFEAERASAEVERQLSLVEGQQDELSGWLDRYEREADEMFARQVGPGDSLQGPDQERERTYKLAEKLSDKLDEMGKDLKSMIEQINDASSTLSKTSKIDDPLSQIVKILNSHLSSLQWIDQNASALQAKVAQAQQASRGMGMGFGSSGGQNGIGNDAASDFYTSYMGSR